MPIGRLTTKSKFYIDPSYWERDGRDFRREVYELLCDECKQQNTLEEVRVVDHVDPNTGEVVRMDSILDCASSTCVEAEDFINSKMPMTRAIFRAFIAAGNAPQSAEEIYARVKKGNPNVILKELLSPQMEAEGVTAV